MVYMRRLIIISLASHAAITFALAGERTSYKEPAIVRGQKDARQHGRTVVNITATTPLDRVATAVYGAELSHGKDPSMWRPDPSGPQGPMQVSEAAATDVGGGDRFDLTQNRAIGRAYLAELYRRYRNWPDAIAAYNWGIGKMDRWVKAGRRSDKFLVSIETYLKHVLRNSGLCNSIESKWIQQSPGTAERSDAREGALDASTYLMCVNRDHGNSSEPNIAQMRTRSPLEMEAAAARSSWMTTMQRLLGCTGTESLRCN